MQVNNLKTQKGFTLVEIAIVLVIIGLLLGGVLKGQELIQNAKVKSVASEFANIEAAYWAYRDRTGTYPTSTNPGFWFDLRTEGFISGDALTVTTAVAPEHALGGSFIFVSAASGNLIPNKQMICASGVEDSIALNIDTKIDDSNSDNGDMQAIKETTAGTALVTGTVLAAYTTTGDSLTICKELQ